MKSEVVNGNKDCGKIYEPQCVDYDHIGGKINSVSRMNLQNSPKSLILAEIKKNVS